MTFAGEVQQLTVANLVTLYALDFSSIPAFTPSVTTLYLTNNKDGYDNLVVDGQEYEYIPIDTSGFVSEINGVIPEVEMVIAKHELNQLPDFQTILSEWKEQKGNKPFDWRGIEVIRIKTLSNKLVDIGDSEKGIYVIDQLKEQNISDYKLKLSVSISVDRLTNEALNVLSAGRCSFRYRTWDGNKFNYTPVADGGCPYGAPSQGTSDPSTIPGSSDKYYQKLRDWAGAFGESVDQRYFMFDNQQTTDPAYDKCSYTLNGCQQRFSPDQNGFEMPFRGLIKQV